MPDRDVLMMIAEDGRVIEWQRLAEELFGWSAEEAVGQSVVALMREIGTDRGRRGSIFDGAPVLVRPILNGTSVVWQVRAAANAVSQQDVAVLKAMFTQSPVGIYVLDNQLRVVRMNTGTRWLRDTPVADLIGKPFTEAFELEDPEQELAVAHRVMDSGVPVLNRLVRTAEAPGQHRRRIYSVSFARLEGGRGDVLGLVASAIDVTERENALKRLVLLDTVRTCVGRRLDVLAVCRELVDAVVPAFTGIAVVEVIEDVVRGEDPPLVPVDHNVPLHRTAFRGGRTPAYRSGDVRPLPSGTPFSHVLSDLRPRLVPIDADTAWLAADPALADSIKRSDAHCLIVAPLALRGHALGVVSFYRHQHEDPFEEEDLQLASDVCAHAALCIDNARRYTRERTIAATLQRRLLPQRPATPSSVEVCQLHFPGPEGGGVWFDAIALPGARTALVVGDVAGRGVAAAVTMGLLRTALHSIAALDLGPDELLARLSDTATRLAAERAALPPSDPLHHESLTAGCAIAIYDPVTLTCALARAGLPEPVAVFPDGTSSTLTVPPGPLLAGTGNAPFPATTVSLPEGTTLAMATAPLASEVLTGPLRPLLDRGNERSLPELRDDITHALTHGHQTDERLMLLARTKALPPDQVLVLPLPPYPEAAPLARAAARRQLHAWGVDENIAFTNELIVSELVGNAVRYGAPPLQLRLILDEMLTSEVSDASTCAPHVKHARTIDETGRGLFIVATLADQWGTRYGDQGKSVWAEQSKRRATNPAPRLSPAAS
ncbi:MULTISPECIES: SpoIIE family protein phosphatase [unclassified Streptomyces]|uniref:SpoIIE family protein phosphatase n=1 Tax=unclassified Streptomyces TaxID=2593676 RepID=UPI00380108D8